MAPPQAVSLIERDGAHYDTRVVEQRGQRFFSISESAMRPITPKMCDPAARVQDMDAQEVDIQAVSAVPFLMYPNVEAGAARTMAQTVNDALMALPRDRFIPLATLPLQAPKEAVAELERVTAKGVRGIEMPPSVGARQLDDPLFEPVFEAAESLGVVMCIHPFEACPEAPFDRYMLGNLVGNLFDTGLAASLLIYGGVLERHPALNVLLYHGGGTLLALIDRLDKGYAVSAENRKALPRPPSTYLQQIAVDTVVFSAGWLAYLIERLGAEHVCLGSDYPLPMGPMDPVAEVRALNLAGEELILGGNAMRLLTLEAEHA